MIKFGPWLPDRAEHERPGLVRADNVFPAAEGYQPVPGLSDISDASGQRLRGTGIGHSGDGGKVLFTGHASGLFEVMGGAPGALTDRSRLGGYTLGAADSWRFAQFGSDMIAAGGLSVPLQIAPASGGTAFADILDAPQAKYLAIVRDFVVAASTLYGGELLTDRVQWSAINPDFSSPSSVWTIGSNQADFQRLAEGGEITGLIGGNSATILLERAIYRMAYVGGGAIFSFQRAEARGCPYPGSIAALGPERVFYYSPDGFFLFDGQTSQPIGAGAVNEWFASDANEGAFERMTAALDPSGTRVLWSYASSFSSAEPDSLLCFDYALGRWSLLRLAHEGLATAIVPAATLEQLDALGSLDDLTTSLDSPQFAGSRDLLAASRAGKLASFSADPLHASLETAEIELAPGRQSMVRGIRPHITGTTSTADITAQVASRARSIDQAQVSDAAAIRDTGLCSLRQSGRYHRAIFSVSGQWRYALGFEFLASAKGTR